MRNYALRFVYVRTVRVCVFTSACAFACNFIRILNMYTDQFTQYSVYIFPLSCPIWWAEGCKFSVCSFGFNCLCVNCKVTRIKIVRLFKLKKVQTKKQAERGERD